MRTKHDAPSILIALIAIALLCGVVRAEIPRGGVARDSVDLIERNYYYDEHGRLVFEQFIFYDWWPCVARYMVRSWRLLKHHGQVPQRDRDGYVTLWSDGELLRVVRAKQVKETWTQFDPELEERQFLPKERRAELLNPNYYLKAEWRVVKAKWEGLPR